ncbi:MAG: hypothetical protein ACRC8K_22830 [Waterburya sp.]
MQISSKESNKFVGYFELPVDERNSHLDDYIKLIKDENDIFDILKLAATYKYKESVDAATSLIQGCNAEILELAVKYALMRDFLDADSLGTLIKGLNLAPIDKKVKKELAETIAVITSYKTDLALAEELNYFFIDLLDELEENEKYELETLASIGYSFYRNSDEYFQKNIPHWQELTERERNGWKKATEAILKSQWNLEEIKKKLDDRTENLAADFLD